MAVFRIPLSNTQQTFDVELSGARYRIRNRWNDNSSMWELDLYTVDDEPLVLGIPLVTGVVLFDEPAPVLPDDPTVQERQYWEKQMAYWQEEKDAADQYLTDLLEQYLYLGIPGRMGVYVQGDRTATPSFDGLGVDADLFYGVAS